MNKPQLIIHEYIKPTTFADDHKTLILLYILSILHRALMILKFLNYINKY